MTVDEPTEPGELPLRQPPTLDPQQAEIHRLMGVFGPTPAAFYADACRLLSDRPPLDSVTHLVGHLLRELESTLRDILRPMAQVSVAPHDVEEPPKQERKDTHANEINAIVTALELPGDDQLRDIWSSLNLHRVGHRGTKAGPRRIDQEFQEIWDSAQILLLTLGRRFESIFASSLPLIDELAAIRQPSHADMSRLGTVPHSTVALDRFYRQAGAGWFGQLRKKHYLSNPPPLEMTVDGTIPYAPWPAGRYLARMAGEPRVRTELMAVILGLTTDNPEAHESVADTALALPSGEAAQLAPKIAEFLSATHQWALPSKACQLVVSLAGAGEIDAALIILGPIVAPGVRQSRWRSNVALANTITAAFPHLGIEGLELISGALDDVLDERRPGPRRWWDHSNNWRRVLDGDREHDYEDVLVSVLRDAAVALARAEHVDVAVVVQLLERRERAIFHRLALHVLRLAPDQELAIDRLERRELVNDALLEREYTLLLREYAGSLPDAVVDEILNLIDAGPLHRCLEADDLDAWTLHQLARFGEHLPERRIEQYQVLVERFGEPTDPWVEASFRWGSTAPLTTDELLALNDVDLLDLLRTWQPADGWSAPSKEGLQQSLKGAAAKAPGRFSRMAPAFARAEAVYAYGLLDGLREAIGEASPLDWSPVLTLCRAVVEQDRSAKDADRWWVDVIREITRLLRDGLSRDSIPGDLDQETFSLLAVLAEDTEPSADYEEQRLAAGDVWPATLDLNTIRGSAFHALVQYAWWRKKQTPSGETPQMAPELKRLLDRHLDPEHEPTRAVRSVYGQFFPALSACDEEWARSRVDVIFPREPSLDHLRVAAWESYLLNNRVYETAYELLTDHYQQAILDLSHADVDKNNHYARDLSDALAGHLIWLYAKGITDLTRGSLIDLYFTHATPTARERFIELIGFDLTNADHPAPGIIARFQRLWDWRINAIKDNNATDVTELEGFGWWFASGHLDDEWALTQLHHLLVAGGAIDDDHGVAQRLADLRHEHLPQVVTCLALVLDAAQQPWFITANTDAIRAILHDGCQASDPPSRDLAVQIVNRLIARGHAEFENLLP